MIQFLNHYGVFLALYRYLKFFEFLNCFGFVWIKNVWLLEISKVKIVFISVFEAQLGMIQICFFRNNDIVVDPVLLC